MSGKPAARIGDAVAKGKIVTGSATVLIGDAAEGQADRCSSCKPAVGPPVNPILGAKLLPAETDFALPAPLPFVFARSYLSRDARCGPLGQGWSLPGSGLGLEATAAATVLIDGQGRRITFGPLAPGEARFSPSERLWIRRGGPIIPQVDALQPWHGRWAAVPHSARHDPHAYFVLSDALYFHFRREAGPDSPARLSAQFDRNGYRTEYAWLGLEGRPAVVSRVRDSAGRLYAFTYRACTRTELSADDPGLRLHGVALLGYSDARTPTPETPADWLVRYHYSATDDLIAVIDRSGQIVRTFQWQHHILVAHGEPGGIDVHYDWDHLHADGRVLCQRETDGLTRHYAYGADHTTVTDSLGRQETYHFEGEGPTQRWSAHTRADGSRLEFLHDAFGRRVGQRDPLGRTTWLRLDGEGRLIGRQHPDASAWRWLLDPDTGDVREIHAPDALSWHIERDTRGNPLAITAPDGAITRYAYDDPTLPDRPTTITDARGGIRRLSWNPLGLLTAHTDCSGHTTTYAYDAEGRLVRHTDALGQHTEHRHDRLGRLTETRRADGSTHRYTYDERGRLVRIERPDGLAETLAWDHAGRLTTHTNAAGHTQHYHYDAAGRLTTLTNENGASAHFDYDPLDRPLTEQGFDGRTQHYTWDPAGQLIARSEASLPGAPRTTYDYDPMGRLIARHLPATAHAPASTETYAWRADGQLAGCANPHAQIAFGFDQAARPCFETHTHPDGWCWHSAHTYNPLGTPLTTSLDSAPALAWLSYGAGHLHGLRTATLAIDFERDCLHREIERNVRPAPNAPITFALDHHYTALGQIASAHLHGPALGSARMRRYHYDALGLISALDDSANGPIAYAYDAAGRLLASRHRDLERNYAYDPAGNRLDIQPDAPTHASACLDNRLQTLDGHTHTFDGAGNLLTQHRPDRSTLTLAYDGAHRLVRLERRAPDGALTVATYTYDALSRRIAKTVTAPDALTTVTRYGWDGERLVCEDNGHTRSTIVHQPDSFIPILRFTQSLADTLAADPERCARAQAAQLIAHHGLSLPAGIAPEPEPAQIDIFVNDHLGTPLALLNPEGRITWQAQPDDWGAVRNTKGSRQPIRFQGQWEDEESGLYYNRYRYYDPATGRYVTQDPIGLAGGMNFFSYPLNPLNRVDPLGLQSVPTQTDNARDTAVNAATTYGLQGMSNAPGGVISAGNAAANGAVAIGGVMQSHALKVFDHYKQLGDASSFYKGLFGGCMKATVESGAWDELDPLDRQGALAAVGAVCLGGKR